MKASSVGAIRKVLLTRSKKGNEELAKKLESLGFEPVSFDTIEFLPPLTWSSVDASLKGLGRFDWLVLTSPTGVEFFSRRMRELSLPLRWGGKPAVAAVGEKTGDALRAQGVAVDFVPSAFLTRALADELPLGRGRHVLVLRADIGNPGLVPSMERRGFRVEDVTLYRTVPTEGARGDPSRGADAVVFASPSAVEAFMSRAGTLPRASLTRLLAVCIGPVTAAAAEGRGFQRVLTAQTHTVDGIVECLASASRTGEVE